MVWLVVAVVILGLLMDSELGKFVLGTGVVALGLLLIGWIFDATLFFTLAKICAGLIVVIVAFLIIKFIFEFFD